MKKIIFILLISHLTLIILNAQWQADVRLTNNPGISWDPSITVSGQLVHVVWRDTRDGNYDIYYKRSTDAGLSWGNDIRLTYNAAVSYNSCQSIACSSTALLHLVWSGERDGNNEIYYKRSTNSGINWNSDVRLTNNPALSEDPSLTVSGQLIHLVWRDTRDGNAEIYYKRSTDGGISWSSDRRLTNNPGASTRPSITLSGSTLHVVWEDNRDGNSEIYYKRSTDAGLIWGNDIRLTNNPSSSYTNYNYTWCVSSSSNNVHVVWYDNRNGNFEKYYKRSTNGGINWGQDTRLTYNSSSSWGPSILVSGSNIHVVWPDYLDGNEEEYYKRSTDGGLTWETDTRLTNNPGNSEHSSVTVSGTVVHVVWEDTRDGNWEIYYKRNPTGNPNGIRNINSGVPKEFNLYQNFPNPFNPITKIRFAISKLSLVTLKVYNILGNEITTLAGEQLQPGIYESEWNASEYASGIYYYNLSAGDFKETKKMVLVK